VVKRCPLVVALSLLFLVVPARTQSLHAVEEISIEGNSVFSSSEVQGFFHRTLGSVYSDKNLEEDLQGLLEAYRAKGYLEAMVDSVVRVPARRADPTGLRVYVSEGEQVRIGSVAIDGVSEIERKSLAGLMSLEPGDPLDSGVIEEAINRMLRLYEERGYLLAAISVGGLTVSRTDSGSFAEIILGVKPGPRARISEVEIEGNETTHDDVIVREIRLDDSYVYSPEAGVRLKERLERLGIFSSVDEPTLYVTDSSTVGLLIKVKEGRPNRFDGMVGYIPAASSSAGYVTGLIDVQFRNLFGTARKLHLRWHRLDRFSQELAADYEEPWIGGIPLNGELSFLQRKQDTTYVLHRYAVSGAYMFTEEFSVGLLFRGSSVVPSESGAVRVPQSTTTEFGLWIHYDSRDQVWSPSSGVVYETSYDRGSKSVSQTASGAPSTKVSTDRATMDLLYYLTVVPRHVVHVGLFGRVVGGSVLDESDIYRLGGSSTLRGYREDQFVAPRLVWSNLEYRFLTGYRSFVFAFFDWGYIAVPVGSVNGLVGGEETKTGYGIGLQADTQLGLIGMSIAFGEGDTFGTAKLHLRISNEF